MCFRGEGGSCVVRAASVKNSCKSHSTNSTVDETILTQYFAVLLLELSQQFGVLPLGSFVLVVLVVVGVGR